VASTDAVIRRFSLDDRPYTLAMKIRSVWLALSFGILLSCTANPPSSEVQSSAGGKAQQASSPAPASAATEGSLVPPVTVRAEKVVNVRGGVKNVTVSNAEGRYALACNTSQDSCVTPSPGKDYLLFTKDTHWKFPGTEGYVDLNWLQEWSGTYKNEENIGLIPADKTRWPVGMYWLVSWEKAKQ